MCIYEVAAAVVVPMISSCLLERGWNSGIISGSSIIVTKLTALLLPPPLRVPFIDDMNWRRRRWRAQRRNSSTATMMTSKMIMMQRTAIPMSWPSVDLYAEHSHTNTSTFKLLHTSDVCHSAIGRHSTPFSASTLTTRASCYWTTSVDQIGAGLFL